MHKGWFAQCGRGVTWQNATGMMSKRQGARSSGLIGRGELYNQVVELVDLYGPDVEMPKLPEDLLEEFMHWVAERPSHHRGNT